MPYSELVKDFGKVRDLMREFYLYGFKKRSEYTSMSARTYDDERRRLESWLGGCMRFERTPEGKNVFPPVAPQSPVRRVESQELHRRGYHAALHPVRHPARSRHRPHAQGDHGRHRSKTGGL